MEIIGYNFGMFPLRRIFFQHNIHYFPENKFKAL